MYCSQCGKQIGDDARFCKYCGHQVGVRNTAQPYAAPAPAKPAPAYTAKPKAAAPAKPKKGNVFLGCIGSLIGVTIVGLIIAYMSKVGQLMSVLGALIPIASVFCFKLFGGGENDKVAVIFGLAMCLIIPYIADRTAWAWALMEENSYLTFTQAFSQIPDLIGNGIEEGTYVFDLVLLYIMTGLGAFGVYREIL